MLESPWSPPTDPRYERFLAGLKQIAENETQRRQWRWEHERGEWYAWSPAKWVLEDVGLPDTAPGSALRDRSLGFGEPNWEVAELFVPELYRRVDAAHARAKAHVPGTRLVWGPWGDGDWRSAWERPPVAPPPPPPGPQPPVSEECRKRIAFVNGLQRQGLITPAAARQAIEQILAECA